jgi:hypothetical protein
VFGGWNSVLGFGVSKLSEVMRVGKKGIGKGEKGERERY